MRKGKLELEAGRQVCRKAAHAQLCDRVKSDVELGHATRKHHQLLKLQHPFLLVKGQQCSHVGHRERVYTEHVENSTIWAHHRVALQIPVCRVGSVLVRDGCVARATKGTLILVEAYPGDVQLYLAHSGGIHDRLKGTSGVLRQLFGSSKS